jgi:hypothetical protein
MDIREIWLNNQWVMVYIQYSMLIIDTRHALYTDDIKTATGHDRVPVIHLSSHFPIIHLNIILLFLSQSSLWWLSREIPHQSYIPSTP